MATLFLNGRLTRTEKWHDTRLNLRTFWRRLLTQPPFAITDTILETTWRIVADLFAYEPPRSADIIQELAHLANFETSHSLLHTLETIYQFRACCFEKMICSSLPALLIQQ